MPYVRRNWQNAPSSATPLNAAALNNIEDGVEEALAKPGATDAAVDAILSDTGSDTYATLTTAIGTTVDVALADFVGTGAEPSRSSSLWTAKSTNAVCRLALYGMSISNFQRAPMQAAAEALRIKLGQTPHLFVKGQILGGSYENTHLGWVKQGYSGPGYRRSVGSSTSTALTYVFTGDTYDVVFDRETDSEAVSVTIDGVSVGTTPAAGAQLYQQHITGTVTWGQHVITINVPTGSGKVYFDHLLAYDSQIPGLIVMDFTLGSTLLSMMRDGYATPADAPRIAAIASENENGIKAHFDRTDVDAIWLGHDVNDATSLSLFTPVWDRAVELTRTRNMPLLTVSSPAGNHAQTGAAGRAGYFAIREAYATAGRTEAHITHIDWHGAIAPSQTAIDDGTWQARDYVTGGDFIHPVPDRVYLAGTDLISRAIGMPTPRLVNRENIRIEGYRRAERPTDRFAPIRNPFTNLNVSDIVTFVNTGDIIRFTRPHNLAVGDVVHFLTSKSGTFISTVAKLTEPRYVVSAPSAFDITVSDTPGGAALAITADGTNAMYVVRENSNRPIPADTGETCAVNLFEGTIARRVRRDPEASNWAYANRATILASGTSDRFGPYVTGNQTISTHGVGVNRVTTMLARVRLSGNTGSLKPNAAPLRLCAPDGSLATYTGVTESAVFYGQADETEPVWVAAHFIATAQQSGAYVAVANFARLYDIYWCNGNFPLVGAP